MQQECNANGNRGPAIAINGSAVPPLYIPVPRSARPVAAACKLAVVATAQALVPCPEHNIGGEAAGGQRLELRPTLTSLQLVTPAAMQEARHAQIQPHDLKSLLLLLHPSRTQEGPFPSLHRPWVLDVGRCAFGVSVWAIATPIDYHQPMSACCR